MAERNRSEPFIEDADRFPENGTRTRRPPSPDQETRRRKTQQRRRRHSGFHPGGARPSSAAAATPSFSISPSCSWPPLSYCCSPL